MKTRNRILALLLCLCMAVTLLPTAALSANTNDDRPCQYSNNWLTQNNQYMI